nr:ATP-binding protein [Limobrevibacterium gyesilva]
MVLVTALVVVQIAGLTIHALDREDLQRMAQARDIAVRSMSLYRSIALVPEDRRDSVVQELDLPDGPFVSLAVNPPGDELAPAPMSLRRQLLADMQLVPIPLRERPLDVVVLGGPEVGQLVVGFRFPSSQWLRLVVPMPPPRPWDSTSFLSAFTLMSVTAAVLILWAVRRLTLPVTTLAAAAEALGRDVNAPPLPETGPAEVATAAAAFNTMAERIRRFVQDRTFMLTAIGHDLRTPITRMRLRAEFVEDEEQRRKMLADLAELEAMVSATLAFGRDAAVEEPVSAVDLAELVRTILDEAADANPALDPLLISYQGPDHLPVRVRPVVLKRALTNLVANAINYGGSARATLHPPADRPGGPAVVLHIDDDGPGIPDDALERVFQPFHRLEASRNRETGGIGLGLSIARNILRAHGGDVTLTSHPQGGARASVTLPV